ncbi:MAG: hypothetical protein JO277_15240 [Candidatus Eremiobacteraeota bacterium]|nr:hypothetical protein [Candidatus Eremiobacteraeota bacterium]
MLIWSPFMAALYALAKPVLFLVLLPTGIVAEALLFALRRRFSPLPRWWPVAALGSLFLVWVITFAVLRAQGVHPHEGACVL